MSEELNLFKNFESKNKIDITNESDLVEMFEALLQMELTSEEQVLEFQERRDQIAKHCRNEWAESYFSSSKDITCEQNKNPPS